MIHRCKFDNSIFFYIIFSLKLQKILIRFQKDSKFLIMFFSPFRHDYKNVFSCIQMLFKNNMFLIAVFPIDPAVSSIILFLKQKASNPNVLCYSTLPVKSVLLLSDIYHAFCLLKEGESTEGSRVVWWDLNMLCSLIFFCFLLFWPDNFGRINWASHRVWKFFEGVDKNCWQNVFEFRKLNFDRTVSIISISKA